jgi:peroxiredoxin-like protein
MHPFPHHYKVSGQAAPAGSVTLSSSGVPNLATDSPREFDGPGDQWSPEGLLTGAVADCFILSFRAIAAASKFTWTKLEVEAEGKLERVNNVNSFTQFTVRAKLTVPAGADAARARMLLEKSEKICLITNSLKAETHLEAEVVSA